MSKPIHTNGNGDLVISELIPFDDAKVAYVRWALRKIVAESPERYTMGTYVRKVSDRIHVSAKTLYNYRRLGLIKIPKGKKRMIRTRK